MTWAAEGDAAAAAVAWLDDRARRIRVWLIAGAALWLASLLVVVLTGALEGLQFLGLLVGALVVVVGLRRLRLISAARRVLDTETPRVMFLKSGTVLRHRFAGGQLTWDNSERWNGWSPSARAQPEFLATLSVGTVGSTDRYSDDVTLCGGAFLAYAVPGARGGVYFSRPSRFWADNERTYVWGQLAKGSAAVCVSVQRDPPNLLVARVRRSALDAPKQPVHSPSA